MRSLLLLLLLLVFSPHQVWAQNEPKKEKGPQFRIVCWSDWKDEQLYVKVKIKPDRKTGGKEKIEYKKIKLLQMAYSSYYPYELGFPVVFYKKTENPEEPYVPLLSVSIPANNSQPVIFLRITKEAQAAEQAEVAKYKFHSQVFDNNPKIFPYGTFRIVNFTKKDVQANFGKEKKMIAPRKHAVVKPKSSDGLRIPAIIKVRGEKKAIYDTIIFRDLEERILLFVAPKRNSKGEVRPRCSSSISDLKPNK